MTFFKVTLEEQMICGALSTLNEDAFEDVASSEQAGSSTGSTGELIIQHTSLQPISEEQLLGSPTHSRYEDFFDDTPNNLIKSVSAARIDEFTVITIPSSHAGLSSIDDTRL